MGKLAAAPWAPCCSRRLAPLYLGLGLLAGPIAALYVHLLYIAQDVFRALPLPKWLKPALGSLLVGLIAIFLLQVMGVGY